MDSIPVSFQASGHRGFYHPVGVVSPGEIADRITPGEGKGGDRDEAEGEFGVLQNLWAVARWAKAAPPELRVARVAREEHICPRKTG